MAGFQVATAGEALFTIRLIVGADAEWDRVLADVVPDTTVHKTRLRLISRTLRTL